MKYRRKDHIIEKQEKPSIIRHRRILTTKEQLTLCGKRLMIDIEIMIQYQIFCDNNENVNQTDHIYGLLLHEFVTQQYLSDLQSQFRNNPENFLNYLYANNIIQFEFLTLLPKNQYKDSNKTIWVNELFPVKSK